jgi:hypothetical protein
MPRVTPYAASVTYRDAQGKLQEEEFPLRARDYSTAMNIASTYVLQVMKLKDFELRVVGS